MKRLMILLLVLTTAICTVGLVPNSPLAWPTLRGLSNIMPEDGKIPVWSGVTGAMENADVAEVNDTAYPTGWNNDTTNASSRNAIYDIIASILSGGQAWTGVHDFGGVTSLEIPNGTDPDVTVAGQISLDTDGGNEPNSISLRTVEGDDQYVMADSLKTYSRTICEPDLLAETSFLPIWTNKTGYAFIITAIGGESDIDDFDFTLKERTASGGSVTTIEAVTLSTNGTSMYYGSVTGANIDHATIDAGCTIGYDNSADNANYVMVWFQGYFNANVD
jgi:hypothetical protein